MAQYYVLLRNVKVSEWEHVKAGTVFCRRENSLFRDNKYSYTSCDHFYTTNVYLNADDLQYITQEGAGLLLALKDLSKRLDLLFDKEEFLQRHCVRVGHFVEVTCPRSSTPLYGVVKYRGPLQYEKGIWFGVELEEVSVYISGAYLDLLAHLWGAYAIPLALSVVHRLCRLQQKYRGYKTNIIVQMFLILPGLCLLDIDGAHHISYNIMSPKA